MFTHVGKAFERVQGRLASLALDSARDESLSNLLALLGGLIVVDWLVLNGKRESEKRALVIRHH